MKLLGITVLSLNLAYCSCYVAYEIFQGFDAKPSSLSLTTTFSSTTKGVKLLSTTNSTGNNTITVKSAKTKVPLQPWNEILEDPTTNPPMINPKFLCPEHEKPVNIGVYEVPTQRDIVFQVRTTMTRLFNSYHEKALYFLKDIKEATKSTSAVGKKCHGYGTDQTSYKKCVQQVSAKCELITKSLVKALESQRRDVEAFTNGTICSIKGLKADPVMLIKTLAMEDASLEFALPGFLRLLSSCSVYCERMEPQNRPKKPLRHMTDQDLIVKHFLTKKNYIQLLKEST